MLKPIILAAALAATVAGSSSQAMVMCGSRVEITEQLNKRHGEVQTAGGLQSSERLLEIWASEETGTWTVLMTSANGMTCVVAHGTDWAIKPPVPKGLPS